MTVCLVDWVSQLHRLNISDEILDYNDLLNRRRLSGHFASPLERFYLWAT